MTISEDGHTLAAAATNSDKDEPVIAFYDTRTDTVLDILDDPRQVGLRSLAVHEDGAILYSIGEGGLAAYDPESQQTVDADTAMPGDWLRAVTDVRDDGISFGVTKDSPRLFSLTADGTANPLGNPQGYTTSLALSDDGKHLFWLPNAHGSAWVAGATVLVMDTESGEISELVSLAPMIEDELELLAGGTYSITYDKGKLILGVNASPLDDDSGFGTVVLVVIDGL